MAFEPGAAAALHRGWGLHAVLGWLFLVLFGSLLAYTIFLRLLRDWGPVRAGSYAFVSPVIAVLVGVAVLHEQVTLFELAGAAAMLTGAWLCAPARRASSLGAIRLKRCADQGWDTRAASSEYARRTAFHPD